MGKVILDGPPWCTFVDPEEAYFRGLARSLGSGLLGGWSCATAGGFFTNGGKREIEAREALARRAVRPGTPPEPRQDLPGARVRPPATRHRDGHPHLHLHR